MSDAIRTVRRIPVAHRAPVLLLAGATLHGGASVVLSSGRDGFLRAWDADTGLATGFAVADDGRAVKFVGVVATGDSAIVISVDRLAFRRFDLTTGQQLGKPTRPGRFGPAAILPGGAAPRLVAAGAYGMVRSWNVVTAEPVGDGFAVPGGEILTIAADRSPQGRGVIITSTAEGQVQRWDGETGEAIGRPLAGHRRPITALVCSVGTDGRGVVIGQEFQGPIHRWDMVTGEPIGGPVAQRGHGIGPGSLAVTPDGAVLISVDAGGTPWRWDLRRPEPVAEPFPREVQLVNAVLVVPSAHGPAVFTAGEKGDLRRWDTSGRAMDTDPIGHPVTVQEVIPVPPSPYALLTGVVVSSSLDGARCWDAESGTNVGRPPFEPIPVGLAMAAAWLPDGKLMLASATDDGLARAEVFSGRYQEEAPEMADDGDYLLEDPAVSDVVSEVWPDGRPFFAAAGGSGAVRLIDAATGDPMRTPLTGLESSALAVAATVLEDGTVLVAAGGEERTILRWNAVTGERIGGPLRTPRAFVMGLAFRALPGGRLVLVAVDDESRVYRWDAVSGEPIGEVLVGPGEPGTPTQLASNAPGTLIAIGQDETVRVWDAGTGAAWPDIPDAASATTVTLADGSIAFAVGRTDGSITRTALPIE